MTRDELIALSNRTADEYGIPRLLLLACAVAESNLNNDARRPTEEWMDEGYWPDVSGGAWQQTVRYDPDYRGGDDYPGPEEVERVLALQRDPVRSARVAAENLAQKWSLSKPDLLAALSAYNWPAGMGRPYSAAHEQNYRRGLIEAEQILRDMGGPPAPTPPAATPATPAPEPPMRYDATFPAIAQNDDWSCSATALRWALWALGRQPGEAWIESTMQTEGVVSTALGLLDASGAGLAAFVKRHYGEDGFGAYHVPSVSFDDVRSVAGTSPILLGGRRWGEAGHWSGVRGYDAATDELLLANPASGYGGITQRMSRQQFAAVAPASMVVVTPPVPAEATPPDELARLRAELADKEARLAAEVSKLGYVSGDCARAADALAEAATALGNTLRSLAPPAA